MRPSTITRLALATLIMGMTCFSDPPPIPGASYTNQASAILPVVVPDLTKPTERKVAIDGEIYRWNLSTVEWFIEEPLWRVEWCDNLLSNDWQTLEYTKDGTFDHNKPEGFYRVIKLKHPTLPPTYPPKRPPTLPPPRTPENSVTNSVPRGGFR